MRLPLRATWPQESPFDLPAFAPDSGESGNVVCAERDPDALRQFLVKYRGGSSKSEKATTVVAGQAFQGWDFRVHFDEDAPPGRGATTVVDPSLPISPAIVTAMRGRSDDTP